MAAECRRVWGVTVLPVKRRTGFACGDSMSDDESLEGIGTEMRAA